MVPVEKNDHTFIEHYPIIQRCADSAIKPGTLKVRVRMYQLTIVHIFYATTTTVLQEEIG